MGSTYQRKDHPLYYFCQSMSSLRNYFYMVIVFRIFDICIIALLFLQVPLGVPLYQTNSNIEMILTGECFLKGEKSGATVYSQYSKSQILKNWKNQRLLIIASLQIQYSLIHWSIIFGYCCLYKVDY
jgi:hypothetical protein